MTDTIRLAEDQLHKIMAAILTASGNYGHPTLAVDEVRRLCDEVDGAPVSHGRSRVKRIARGTFSTTFDETVPIGAVGTLLDVDSDGWHTVAWDDYPYPDHLKRECCREGEIYEAHELEFLP